MFGFLKNKNIHTLIDFCQKEKDRIVKEIEEEKKLSVSDLIRDKFKGIKFEEKDLFEGMIEKDIKDFKSECSIIFSKPCFLKVLNGLVNEQVNFTVRKASDMEQVNFGRATINGIELVREVFESFDQEIKKENKKEDDFDINSII